MLQKLLRVDNKRVTPPKLQTGSVITALLCSSTKTSNSLFFEATEADLENLKQLQIKNAKSICF